MTTPQREKARKLAGCGEGIGNYTEAQAKLWCEIETALLEERECTIRECQKYFKEHQCVSGECDCGGTVDILSLLTHCGGLFK